MESEFKYGATVVFGVTEAEVREFRDSVSVTESGDREFQAHVDVTECDGPSGPGIVIDGDLELVTQIASKFGVELIEL
jgi:hypothetical protein